MEKDFAVIKLLFTRHGQTEDNAKGTICGQQPGVLTKSGKQQAKKIGVHLNKTKEHFHHIYVSDLSRTVATFQNIKSQAKYLQQIPIVLTKVIRQRCGGILQGQPLGAWKQNAEKQKKPIRQYKCEKGESWIDVNTRCREFLKLLIQKHILHNKEMKANEQIKIFAVSHGGYLMQMHNVLGYLSQKKEGVLKNTAKNCSFHQFQIEYPLNCKQFKEQNIRMKCLRQNFIEHLK